jgi:hypothetical protein
MTVTSEDHDAMKKLLNIMEGKSVSPSVNSSKSSSSATTDMLAGPGQVTEADVNAMASVMKKLQEASNQVVDSMITESSTSPKVAEALSTTKVENGVKVGRYQIMIKEEKTRIAGKQYFSIYNSLTNDILADDISLYETALLVVRHLNSGKFVNHTSVRELFELDETYTSHKIDALRYKRLLKSNKDPFKKDLYESRYQASLDRCMTAKKSIKKQAI